MPSKSPANSRMGGGTLEHELPKSSQTAFKMGTHDNQLDLQKSNHY